MKLRNNAVKSSFILLAMLISVFGISAGRAQETIDVAKITCDQFLAGRVTDSRTLSIWLSGYYNGTRHNTVVDVSAFQKQSIDVMDYWDAVT
jgi:HdeA/HdeB family